LRNMTWLLNRATRSGRKDRGYHFGRRRGQSDRSLLSDHKLLIVVTQFWHT